MITNAAGIPAGKWGLHISPTPGNLRRAVSAPFLPTDPMLQLNPNLADLVSDAAAGDASFYELTR